MFTQRFALVVVALISVVTSVAAFTQAGSDADRTIYGAGTNSCSHWTDAREGETWITSGQWILGFVSAANQFSKVPPAKTDARSLASWIDDYCYEHPMSDLAEAARELVEWLISRPTA
jgi:hypothetical protein